MIRNQDTIDQLASRIERAYRRRNPGWIASAISPGVWISAALRLLQASAVVDSIPIDPELFVAVQSRNRLAPDPWSDLTQRTSLNRYLKAMKRIISQLRDELNSEVHRAECRMIRGLTLDRVLETEGTRISPMACYILAYRFRRPDLSLKYRDLAESQHRSCPLYRLAARSLLPTHAYPSTDLKPMPQKRRSEIYAFSLN